MAVVLISDEDESGNTFRNKASHLVQLVDSIWNGVKNFVFHSIIVKIGDSECERGHGEAQGHEYSKLSEMTNGIIGSICEPDYSDQLSDMGQAVQNQLSTIQLECVPVDKNRDGHVDIVIQLEDGSPSPDFIRDGQKLTFGNPLPFGNHNIEYPCLID